ncbi:phosphomannomutase/phosphoglucomutase [Stomatohabitans albus]|uniref:phosphomannomutase/phosphoglucomutase n=1 Tax=Stomatohabitans albus TaxID=3110766 RepID=UPI00300D46B0
MSANATDGQLEALFNPHDIRGVWGETLDEYAVRQIVRAAVRVLRGDEDAIVLGRDGRLSSPAIHAIAVEEITRAGLGVVDVGETATEVVYFGSGMFRLPGIMITASHNSAPWNGFKFCRPLARPVGKDSGLWDIRAFAADPNLPAPDAQEPGPVSDQSALSETYANHIRRLIPLKPNDDQLTIVIDAANGMANVVAPIAFQDLNVIWLADRIDGRFPDHEPNPLKSANLANLIETVRREQADLGLAFDGDADRLILVTETGEAVPPALAQSHIARLAISRFTHDNQPPVVLYSEVSSQTVPLLIESSGATAVQTPVGHSAIKALMATHHAIAAVEHSGHYYFNATFNADSALLAAALVINDLIAKRGTCTVRERLADLPRWYMAEEENWTTASPDTVYAQVRTELQFEPSPLLGGGVAYQTSNWRATLRPSNTEPLLRFNVEADAEHLLKDIQARFQLALHAAGAQPEG